MKNSELEAIIDKMLERQTKLEQALVDLKQVIVWREHGVLKDGTEMRERIDRFERERATEAVIPNALR